MSAVILKFPTPLKPHDHAYHAALTTFNYFDETIKSMESALLVDDRGIIAGMHNVFGGFSPDIKNRFLSFINQPSFDSWLMIRDYLIDLGTTSWQLWIKFDPAAPRSCGRDVTSGPFPKPDDFIRYYALHRSERLEMLRRKRDEAKSILEKYE